MDPIEMLCEDSEEILKQSFRFLRKLGEGAHGKAYLVELGGGGGVPAVLKVPKPDLGDALRDEADMLSLVDGAGGAPELLREGKEPPYICMSYRGSRTLDDLWEDNLLDEKLCYQLFLSAGRSLAAIHAKGVVHNDLKPDNMVVQDPPESEEQAGRGGGQPQVSIIDFGAATLSGASLPSPDDLDDEDYEDYKQIAPEVFSGEICLPAGDVYSLGFMMNDILNDLVKERHIGAVRPAVVRLMDQMVLEDYRARPDLAEVITCLGAVLDDVLSSEDPEEVTLQKTCGKEPQQQAGRRGWRWWTWTGAALGLFLLLLVLLLPLLWLWVVSPRYEAAALGCRLHNEEAQRAHLTQYWWRLKVSFALKWAGVPTNLGVPSRPAGLRECRPLPLLLEALASTFQQGVE